MTYYYWTCNTKKNAMWNIEENAESAIQHKVFKAVFSSVICIFGSMSPQSWRPDLTDKCQDFSHRCYFSFIHATQINPREFWHSQTMNNNCLTQKCFAFLTCSNVHMQHNQSYPTFISLKKKKCSYYKAHMQITPCASLWGSASLTNSLCLSNKQSCI